MFRRLVVLSGFDTTVAERIKKNLNSQQTEVAFRKLPCAITTEYFHALAHRACELINRMDKEGAGRIVGVLASCAKTGAEYELERRAFFPALRRLGFPAAASRDQNGATGVARGILDLLRSEDFNQLYRFVRPAPDAVLSLPVENCRSAKLVSELGRMYEFDAHAPSAAISKEIVRRKGGLGLKVKGLDFRGVTNGDAHPVRRCSDNAVCDVAAAMRLGFKIPPRFEFDVSCETGLSGKRFTLCNGQVQTVSASATHLNMRINGDFREG
ncbi:MAG TPA: hypothetical protein VD906_00770 [Caulobacteraceae bacterium]|nr:hypothetical protein [Caulobacteraceae bacterium]